MADHSQSASDGSQGLRGIDPAWDEERGDYLGIMVQAPCEAVVDQLLRHRGFFPGVADLLREEVTFQGDEWERAVYVFQIHGSEWTQIQGLWMPLDEGLAEPLSKQLETFVFLHAYSGTSGVYGYFLYRQGEMIEEYAAGETGEFDGNWGEDERRRKTAEGWQIDLSGGRQLFTLRGTTVDLESQKEFLGIPDRVAAELGFYMAAEPWGALQKMPVDLRGSNLRKEDFRAAQLIFAKDRCIC